MSDKEELLPCPCCGGVDLVDEKSYVMCLSCGLMICHDDAEHADFRSVWNTRPAPSVQDNWIECSDRLPAQYRDVPIQLDDGSQRVGRINYAGTWLVASYQKCRNQYSAVVVLWFDTPAPEEQSR